MAKDREHESMNPMETEGEFSLESILAEYKGSAYISGDKKTPTEVLDEQAKKIIEEAMGESSKLSKTPVERPVSEADDDDFFKDIREAVEENVPTAEPAVPADTPLSAEDFVFEFPEADDTVVDETGEGVTIDFGEEIKTAAETYGDYKYASADSSERYGDEVRGAIEREDERDREQKDSFFAALLSRFKSDDSTEYEFNSDDYEEPLPEEEPDLMAESKRFGAGLKTLLFKTWGAFAISFLMLIFTFIFEAGKSVPFGIGTSKLVFTGVMLIMQMLVMLLGLEVLIEGLDDLIGGRPGAESLVLLSCFFTLLSGIIMMITKNASMGAPFCVVSAFSLSCAMHSKKLYRLSMKNSLRTAVAASAPYGVYCDKNGLESRIVVKKTSSTIEGFYRKLTQKDVAESAYDLAAPIFIVASLVFAILIAIIKGGVKEIAFSFSAMLAASASFSAMMSYSLPFSIITKQTQDSGAAVAGWGGAVEIAAADGVLITDEDVFPRGTVSLNGIKLFDGASQAKALSYSASVIIASGSGLARIFADLLKTKNLTNLRVDDFSVYEGGGLGALIRGERVMVGSTAFMNLMGIRVPDSINVKNAVFCAINDQLVIVYTLNYVPSNSVQSALASMQETGTGMILSARDFNITPLLLQQKFKVTLDDLEYIPQEDSYRISDEAIPKGSDVSAVICREGFSPFAETIICAKKLKTFSEIMTGVSILGSVIGIILMFFLCWTGSFESATAGNAMKFMLAIHAVILIISVFVRKRK